MTRIEQLEALNLSDLPPSIEELQKFCGGTVRELISAYRHIEYLLNRIYGRKKERFVDPNQMEIPFVYKTKEPPALPPPPPEPEKETITYQRAKPRGKKFASLPVIEEHSFPKGDDLCCAHCGEAKKEVMTEEVSQLHYEPCKLSNKKTIKHIYKCAHGCESGLTAPAPAPHIIEKCSATPELLSHVIVSKYVDHLPLHRIGKMFRRQGLNIADTTLIGWMNQFGAAVLVLASFITERVLETKLIGTDDTLVTVLNCSKEKKSEGDWNGSFVGRFWQYQSLEGWISFDYTPSRSSSGPAKFLKGYKGYLQADDYAGYNPVYGQGATQVGCFAHARRKFFELPGKHKHREEALRYIGGLYQVERQIKTEREEAAARKELYSDEQVVALRESRARAVFDNFKTWLDERIKEELPKSEFSMAANYVLSNQAALSKYLSVGFIPIDNNWVERKHRCVAIGRKNWLFCGNDQTAQYAARIITLMANCVAAQVNPYDYLVYLMKNYTATKIQGIYNLTPQGYKEFLVSNKPTAPP